jgi:hypothetical protein
LSPISAVSADGIPNATVRNELRMATPRELADILAAFDVTAIYDKQDRKLHLAATVPAEHVSERESLRRHASVGVRS